jgi:hypothetical protein
VLWQGRAGERSRYADAKETTYLRTKLVDLLVQMGVPVAAANVVDQRIFDGGEGAVVHVAAAIGEIAKTGSLEATHIGVLFRDRITADVVEITFGVRADAEIVKFVVGEQRAAFAHGGQTVQLPFLALMKILRPRSSGESAFKS